MNQQQKNKAKHIMQFTGWLLIAGAGIFLLVAAAKKKKYNKCRGLEISISGASNSYFIDTDDVLTLIRKSAGGKPEGKSIEYFDLLGIEKALMKDVWIKDANLYFDNNDVLHASIEEREPVARVFSTGNSSFYIDSTKMMLPLSEKFSVRIPVFTGFPTEAKVLSRADSNLLTEIKMISMLIQKDPFLMAMIDQVEINRSRSFELVPKMGNQLILFGNALEAAAKFHKLKLFYKNVINKTGFNRYHTIDLQYNNQVVARIRGKEDIQADSMRTIQLMKLIAERAKRQAADSIQTFMQDNVRNTTDSTIIQHSIQREETVSSYTLEKPLPLDPGKIKINKQATRPMLNQKPGPDLKLSNKNILQQKTQKLSL